MTRSYFKAPRDLQEHELDQVIELIRRSGEVEGGGLGPRVRKAQRVGIVVDEERIIGVGVVKNPTANHIQQTIQKSGFGLPEDCRNEIGYIFVDPAYRGQGLGRDIADSLVRDHGGKLFATTREDNGAMRAILGSLGFEQKGKAWVSSVDSTKTISLWFRDA